MSGPGARPAGAWTRNRAVRRRSAGAALVVALLSVPLAVMVLGALHAPGAPPPVGLEIIPDAPSLAAFTRAFALVPLGRQLLNSLTIVAIAVPLTVVVRVAHRATRSRGSDGRGTGSRSASRSCA